MKFLKKLALIALINIITLAPLLANTLKQNVAFIIPTLNKAIESELNQIFSDTAQSTSIDNVLQVIKTQLPALKTNIAQAVKNLPSEQREIVINWLQELKALTATTTQDLLSFGHALQSKEQQNAIIAASLQYLSELDALPEQTYEQRMQLLQRKKEVDMHNPLFNKLKGFMCQCAWLEEQVDLITHLPIKDTALQDCSFALVRAIAYPFDMLNELNFAPSWEEEFTATGSHLAVAHVMCAELLKVVETR